MNCKHGLGENTEGKRCSIALCVGLCEGGVAAQHSHRGGAHSCGQEQWALCAVGRDVRTAVHVAGVLCGVSPALLVL